MDRFSDKKSDASRSDPVLVTLDGVTIAKTRFLVTKSGPFWCPRTDGRTDGMDGMDGTDGTDGRHGHTHTHRFLEPLYTISPSGKNSLQTGTNTQLKFLN